MAEITTERRFDQMDKWARNARLYERLKAEGLFVEPVYETERQKGIDYLLVSAGTMIDRQG